MARTFSWSRRPAESTDRPSTPIYRIKRGQSLQAVVISHDVLGANIHFLRCTIPHIDPPDKCEGCQAGRTIRWEGYIAVWDPRSNAVGIVPLNPTAAETIDAYYEQHGTLKGAELHASRPSAKNNARVNVTLRRSDHAVNTLPQAPDIEKVLMHVWGLNEDPGVNIIKDVSQAVRGGAAQVPSEADVSASHDTRSRQLHDLQSRYQLNGEVT